MLEAMGRLDRVRLLWGKGLTIPPTQPSPLPMYVRDSCLVCLVFYGEAADTSAEDGL